MIACYGSGGVDVLVIPVCIKETLKKAPDKRRVSGYDDEE